MSVTICAACKVAIRCAEPQGATFEFWEHVQKSDGCWLWLKGRTGLGYGQVRIKGQRVSAHRLAWMLSNGPIPHGMCVCHFCDNPPCVRPDHLFLGTRHDNVQDMIRKGRRGVATPIVGEANNHAKLRRDQVLEIRRTYSPGHITMRALGEKYGVGRRAIEYIVHRKTWKWLK